VGNLLQFDKETEIRPKITTVLWLPRNAINLFLQMNVQEKVTILMSIYAAEIS